MEVSFSRWQAVSLQSLTVLLRFVGRAAAGGEPRGLTVWNSVRTLPPGSSHHALTDKGLLSPSTDWMWLFLIKAKAPVPFYCPGAALAAGPA